MRQLIEIEQNARFVSVNARYARQYVLVDSGEYADALPVNDALFAEFPRNPVCLYNRALILERLGRARDAVPIWRRLIAVLYAFPPPSQGFLAECHYHLAVIAHQAGHADEARRLLERALRHARSRRMAEEIDGPYEDFNDLRTAIRQARRSWHSSEKPSKLLGGAPGRR